MNKTLMFFIIMLTFVPIPTWMSDARAFPSVKECMSCHRGTFAGGSFDPATPHGGHVRIVPSCGCHNSLTPPVTFKPVRSICTQCHGRPADTPYEGAGLRKHHEPGGLCSICHSSDPIKPAPEDSPLGNASIDPCGDALGFNAQSAPGLDNDGDDLYNDADPDCISPCDDAAIRCNDGIACTDDSCDPVTGQCFNTPNDANCDDGVACTDDTCDPFNDCQHLPNNLCCDATDCNDNDPCTNDICGPDGQCTNPPNGTCECQVDEDCDDNDACTSDACLANQCENTVITCDDGNACTVDSCDSATGCYFNTPVDCNDDNDCTDDNCIPAIGCVHTNNDNNACDDRDPCTLNDSCSDGTCVGEPDPVCAGCIPPLITRIGGSKTASGLIRIIGEGFGDQIGSVHVNNFMYDPNNHRYKLKLWSDTMIKIRLPRYKCNWFNGDNDGDPDVRKRKIWVVTADGCESEKKPIRIRSENCD